MGFIRLGGNLETGEGGTTLAGAATMRGEPPISDGECFMVENVVRPLPSFDTRMDALSRDGEALVSNSMRCPVISFDVWVLGSSARRRDALHSLAGILAAREPTRLEFSDDRGRYYHVVRTGPLEPVEHIDSAMVRVQLKSVYPWMFGETVNLAVTTASQTFTPGGNHPGALVLASSSSITTDASGNFTMLGLQYGGFDASTAYNVREFNTETRQSMFSTVGYNAPKLSSTWPSIVPGSSMTLRITTGTGTVNLAYTERWL